MKRKGNFGIRSEFKELRVDEMKSIVGGCEWLYNPSWLPERPCLCGDESRSDYDSGGGPGARQYEIVCADGRSKIEYTCKGADTFCYGMEYNCYPW